VHTLLRVCIVCSGARGLGCMLLGVARRHRGVGDAPSLNMTGSAASAAEAPLLNTFVSQL
jgi:hypothetical protein